MTELPDRVMEDSPLTTGNAGRSRPSSGRSNRVWQAVRTDIPFLLLIAAFILAVAALHVFTGVPRRYSLAGSYRVVGGWVLLYALLATVGNIMYRFFWLKESLLGVILWRGVASRLLAPVPTIAFLIIFLILPYWLRSFVAMKASIPDLLPFAWDERFFRLDRLLHFGTDPWRLVHPIVGYPLASTVIDFVYRLWFPVMWMTVIWQAWHAPRTDATRSQFLLSFAVCWTVLGVGLATLFSSVGPIFYGSVIAGPDPYAPLLDYLRSVAETHPLTAIGISQFLWTSYTDLEAIPLGISAMPSLHVSVAVLLTMLGFQTTRWLGCMYAVFAIFIFVGSIHLAWHYAIDGYVAAVLTIGIWRLCGTFARRWQGGSATSGAVA